MTERKEFLELKIGEILVRKEWLNQEHLEKCLQIQKEDGRMIGQILVDNGHIGTKKLYQGLALQHNMTFLDLNLVTIPEETLQLIPNRVAHVCRFLPLIQRNALLLIAIADPKDIRAETEARRFVGHCEVRNVLVCPDDLTAALQKYYGPSS